MSNGHSDVIFLLITPTVVVPSFSKGPIAHRLFPGTYQRASEVEIQLALPLTADDQECFSARQMDEFLKRSYQPNKQGVPFINF